MLDIRYWILDAGWWMICWCRCWRMLEPSSSEEEDEDYLPPNYGNNNNTLKPPDGETSTAFFILNFTIQSLE